MAPLVKEIHSLTEQEVQIIVIVNITASILSLIGTLYVVIHYFLLKSLRRQLSYRLILWVAISDGIYSLSQLLGAPNDDMWCKTQGIVMNFGAISSILWVDAVSLTIWNLMSSTIKELPTRSEINQFVYCLHFMIWTLSALMALFPLLTDTYGPSGGWCWFKTNTIADDCWVIAFYSIVWVSIAFTIFVYLSIWSKFKKLESMSPRKNSKKRKEIKMSQDSDVEMAISKSSKSFDNGIGGTPNGNGTATGNGSGYHRHRSSADTDTEQVVLTTKSIIRPLPGAELRRQDTPKEIKRKRTLRRISLFPMVLVFCFLPGSVRRIIDIAGGEYPYWVAVIQAAILSLIGLFDAIVYGMTKEAKKKDMEMWRKLCSCFMDDDHSQHRPLDLEPQDSGQN